MVSVKVTPGSAGGPANVVATGVATARITVGGTAVEVYLSNTYIVGPLIAAGIDSFSAGAPIPTSLMNSLIAAVANRAARHPISKHSTQVDQTHDAGPADGSRHGGKLSTSPHSRPATRNKHR